MLTLRREEGQWVELTHSSGDVLRVQTRNVRPNYPGMLDLVFDDPDRRFRIERQDPARLAKVAAAKAAQAPAPTPVPGAPLRGKVSEALRRTGERPLN